MYEFEGLLFSDPCGMAVGLNLPELEDHFQRIRDAFDTPEAINDSPMTAPSKRIRSLCPGYEKPLHGSLAAIEIGLPKIRGACPLFDAWLRGLERLIAI